MTANRTNPHPHDDPTGSLGGDSFYSPRDHALLEILAGEAQWTGRHEALLLELWAQGFQANEDMVAFLLRKNVLAPEALGPLTDRSQRPASVFQAEGFARLEAMLDRLEALPVNLNGDSSVLDSPDLRPDEWAAMHDTALNLLAAGETAEIPSSLEDSSAGGSGRSLGDWELMAVRHRSQQAITLSARHMHTGQRALIKAQSNAAVQRESRLLAGLDHPHIVRLLGVESHQATGCLVLEPVEGPSLAEMLAEGRLPRTTLLLTWGSQVARAAGYLAERGVVHRAISPATVFVGSDETVRLMEFSQALELPRGAGGGFVPIAQPKWIGVAGYVAPEQAELRPVDSRADIFSLGAVLYELLTGRQPFAGSSLSEILLKNYPRPEAPVKLNPSLGARLSRMILAMLAKQPSQRPSSFDEIAEALAHSASHH